MHSEIITQPVIFVEMTDETKAKFHLKKKLRSDRFATHRGHVKPSMVHVSNLMSFWNSWEF